MKLTFTEGLFVGFILSLCLTSVIIDKGFISKNSLKGSFYMGTKMYRLCETK